MNARNMGFQAGTFDIALCGFMGWDDCFDFDNLKFTRQDSKAPEIQRVLRSGGKFWCCSWEAQEDITWMEDEILRHYPAILNNNDYIAHRPIGMSYEKAEGYEMIFQSAGFKDIEISKHTMTFISTDEEEWWWQMQQVGWEPILSKIDADMYQKIKDGIFKDLQSHKKNDGIYFDKTVFFVCGRK